jgi:hypothetical protein
LFEEGPKILAPYRSSINAFCYTEEEVFGGTDTYFIHGRSSDQLKLLSAYLNSTLALVWFKNLGKVKGASLELTGDNLQLFPLPPTELSPELSREILRTVDAIRLLVSTSANPVELAHLDEYKATYEKLDSLVIQAYGLSPSDAIVLSREAARAENVH